MKTYNEFLNEKWTLKVNENLFDKIESIVKGQSEKGKIIKQLLDKNGLKESGEAYAILYLGGSNPGKQELSNPIDYLRFQPNVCKIDSNDNLIILDEKSKNLKVPDTMTFLLIADKTTIEKNSDNESFLFKPGSLVRKSTYKFDLSNSIPTVTLKNLKYSIPTQNWLSDGEPEVINLDDDINEITEEEVISFKTIMNMITLQQFVDNINNHAKKQGIIEYFIKSLNFKTDKQAKSETQTNNQTTQNSATQPNNQAATQSNNQDATQPNNQAATQPNNQAATKKV